MKCISVSYNEETGDIGFDETVQPEEWPVVCRRFDDDVHRIRDVDKEGYTGLYQCFDEENNGFYFLVEEDHALLKLKHQTFLKKLGKE